MLLVENSTKTELGEYDLNYYYYIVLCRDGIAVEISFIVVGK